MKNEIPIKVTDNFNKEDYNNFVFNNQNTSIFQTLEMAEVYSVNKDTRPLILVAINEENNEILASLLAKILSHKNGFLKSYSTHSTIRGGPIFKDDVNGISATSKLLLHYNNIVKKDVLYSRIYPLNDTPQIIPTFNDCEYEYKDWRNYLLRLDKPIDELWKQMKKNKRWGVNTAKKSNVSIEEINDKSLLPIFYRLLQETFTNRGSLLEDISNFEATFDILVPKKMAKFFMAKHEGRYIASLLLLIYKDTTYVWYIGSSKKPEDLALCPNDLLFWHVIELYSNNGLCLMDFGGGGTPEQAAEGWVQFKERFGGELVNYGRYTTVHKQKKLWVAQKGLEFYKNIKSHKN